jgi:hypothetical protein
MITISAIIINFPHPFRPTLGPTQPPIQWVMGPFPRGKQQGCGINYPTHLGQRLRKEYSYTSTPLWAFMACSKVNFTFAFIIVKR